MMENNVKAKAPESLADRYSAGHKAISVVLSAVLLGFGWPAVNPAEIYADDGTAQAVAAADAQSDIEGATTNSSEQDASGAAAADSAATSSDNSASSQAASGAASTAAANADNDAAGNNAEADAADTSAAAAEATSYDLKLELNNASLKTVASSTADVQVINPPSTKVTVPAKKDFKFTVTAASGYKLDKVNLTIAGVETELSADDQGVYTIPAESLAADMSLELATSADNQAATQAATDSDATPIDQIDDGVVAAANVPTISGPTEVLLGTDEIKFTWSGGNALEWDVYNIEGGNALNKVSEDANSATFNTKVAWVFSGDSIRVQLKVQYQDPNNQYNRLTSEPFTVTIKKRELKVSNPPSFEDDEVHYWVPEITDAITGEKLDASNGKLTINYYKDGVWVGNQHNIGSVIQWQPEKLTGPGEYRVEVVSADGWAYKSGTTSIDIPDNREQPELAVSGPDTVEQFDTIQLTPELSGTKKDGTYTWSSNNENILTVDENGKVTGVSEGKTTVTVTWTSADGSITLSATHDVTVTHTTNVTHSDITFYYLNDPAGDLDGNNEGTNQGKWSRIGNAKAGKINLTGISNFKKDNGKTKIYDADQRVVEWPDGTKGALYSVQRGSSDWKNIVDNYKSVIESKLPGITVEDKDIASITLKPYKITNNDDGIHVDCQVVIECNKIYTVRYLVDDPEQSGTGYIQVASKENYLTGDTTDIVDFGKSYPETKTVNGVEYTFSGWHLDSALTQSVSLPYTVVDSNLTFYAKYLAGRQVIYNLDGGTWGNSASTNYSVNEGSSHTVLGEPTKTGCTFAGWAISGLDGQTAINSGDTFTMPNNNVTITAQWTAAPAKVTVNYLWGDEGSNEAIADSMTIDDLHYGDVVTNADHGYIKDIPGYTAKSDNKTQVVLNSENGENVINVYYYKNVTLKANSSTGTGFVYNGKEQKLTGYKSYVGDDQLDGVDFSGVTARGAGIDAGTYPVNFNDGAKGKVSTDGKYIVSELVPGELYISAYTNEVTVRIKGHTSEVTYDGTEHTVQGYDAEITGCDFYYATYISYSGDAAIAQTDVLRNGTGSVKAYTLALDGSKFANTSTNNFTNVKFDVASGLSLKINPKSVTLKSADLSKEYDGTPLTNGDAALEKNEGFVDGQGVTCTFNGSQVAVGDSANSFTYEANEGTNLNNYAISKSEGKLTVTDRNAAFEITVKAASNTNATNKYSGREYKAEGIEGVVYEGIEQSGATFTIGGATFTVTGLITSNPKEINAGTYENKISGTAKIVDAYGNDVTKQFKVNTEDGKLVINKRQVTLTSGTASKQYDGTALTNHDVQISGDGFLGTQTPWSNDVYTFAKDGKASEQTEVGSSKNYFVYNPTSSVIANNYEFTYVYGDLTVTENEAPIVVTVTMNSDATPVYDGNEHSVSGYTVTSITANGEPTDVYPQDSIQFNGSALTKTDAGTYEYSAAVSDFVNMNTSFTDVKFVVISGTLTIAQRSVTLKSADLSKEYDGTPLTNGDAALEKSEGFVDGQGVTCTFNGSQVAVGDSANSFTYDANEGTNLNNYAISKSEGTLTVTPQPIDPSKNKSITVEAPEDTKYNGTDQKREPVVKSGDTVLVNGEDYTLSYSDDVKNVGTVTVTITGKGNYEGTTMCTYKITKRDVTLASGTETWTYDGSDHSNTTVDVSGDGFVPGEGASYSKFATVNAVASDVENTFNYALNEGTLAGNYNITQVSGKLNVVAKDMTAADMQVEPLSDVVYNGGEQKFEPVVKDGGTRLVKDRDYTLSYSEDLVNVGEVTVTIDGIGNYKGTTKVEYSITKRPVKLVSFDGTWTYDGKEHSDHEVLVTSYYNFVNGEVSNLQATGAITEPGSVKNAISFTKNENYKDANYDVTMTEGMLTVNAKDLNAADMKVGQLSDVVYNGQDQAQRPTVTDGDKTLVEGTDYDISFSGDVKNVTKEGVTVTITGKGNYKGTVERIYRITPAKLTVKTESDSRAYNGKDLTAGGSIDGFVNGESAAFTVTGKQNSVGSSTNTYEINWDGATASKSNYDIDEQLGMLTVTESTDEIVVTTVGGSYTYDGLTHEPTVTVSNLPEGYTVQSAVSNTTAKDVNTNADGKGGVAVTADTLVILNANKEDVTSKLNITKIDGTLAITAARVVVNTPSANKVYDGEALTAAGSISGLMLGETVDFKTTGTQKDKGSSDNSYELNWTGSAKESNYTVEKSVGKLTVTTQSITPGDGEAPDPSYKGITISNPSDAKYDGDVHRWDPVVKSSDGKTTLAEGTDYTVTYKRGDAETGDFKNVGIIAVVITGIGNYSGTVTKTYEITKRDVTLTSADGSWTYNGKEHVADSVKVTAGDGFVEGEGFDYGDFPGVTNVTAEPVENTFSYKAKNGTDLGNYNVTVVNGKLSVTKAEAEGNITLTGKDATKTYDGKPISAAAAAATVGFGNSVKIEYSTDKVNWTENPAGISITDVVDSKTVYVRASSEVNYSGYVYAEESLSVTPATVTVTTGTASKTYDGSALKADGSISGIVDGETYDFKVTGSQTGQGTSDNTYSLKWNDDTADGAGYTAKASNYKVEENVGTLTVNTRSIDDAEYGMAVDSPSNIEYDGAAHQWAPTVTDNGKILTTGIDYEVAYSKDDFTNVTGEITVTITGKGNYTGTVTRTYQITPAPLTVTTEGASKVYDNNPLTHDVASIAGLKNNETATIHATGSQTVVGDSDNTYEITWNGTADESNYSIAKEELGKLTVTDTEAAIVATPQTVTATYDGQAHGTTVEVTGVPTGYSVKTATSKATATNVADGTVTANVDDLAIVNAQGVDVTKELNITRNTGTITINPATLTVTTEGASKEYDGTALTNSTIDVSGFVNNETAKAETTGTITEVGTTSNGYKLDWGNVDSRNYSVSEALGTLEVTESNKAVEITSASASKTYDGSALTADGATATGLPAGFTVAVSTKASQTDAGTADNTIDSYQIFNADGKDVTKMFAKVSTVSGKLTVNKKGITVTTEGATKVFDGTALTNNKGSIDGLVQGETATVQPNGTQTAVGSSSNGYAIAWGTAKEGNYNVASSTLGTLAVTSQSLNPEDSSYKGISVSDPSDTTYDGTSHTWAPTVTDAKGNVLTPGTDYDVTFNTDDFTDTGTITATITGKGNYTGTVTKSYTIAKAKVSISTESADKVYDGDALTAGGEIAGLVNNETADFAATGSQTAVGSSTNGYRLAWTGTAKESNYQIESIKLGTLTVKQSEDEIVVTTVGGTFTYDGQAHGATVTVSTLPQGYTLDSASSDASATDANGEGIEATANNLVIRNAAGQDVTSDLKVTYVNGTIVVKPAELSIETGSASKVFDGTAITAAGSIKGFVNGEDATFTVMGSQTEVGSSQNGYELSFDRKAKEGNYVIASEDLGTLTITAQSITPGDGDTPSADYRGIEVTTPTDVVYDNAQHQWTPVVTDANGNVLTEGVDYEVAYDTDDFVNVGQIAVAITGIGNYKGTVVRTYRITPAALTITTGSATKVFDGSALTSSELSIEGLKGADTVAARTTGEQTEVGSSQNTYTIDWRDVNQANYEVTEQLGTLTVEAAPVVPVPGTDQPGTDQPGTDQPGTTTPDGTNPGTTPGGTPATTGTTPAPAGPIEAIGQVLEAGYEAMTGDTSASPAAEEQIYDEENPLGKAEHQTCWVHFYMILGMLLTALYGVLVWLRRGNHTRKLRNDMNDILDGGDGDSKESPAATNQPATEA